MAFRRWTGTISREVGLFCWRSACVTRRAVNASDQLGKIGGKGGRSERTRRCALARWQVSLPPLLRCKPGCLGEDTLLCLNESHVPFRPGALLRYLAPRYQQASPAQKTLLLDSFVEWTGYTRKYAIELLNHREYDQQAIQRRRLPQYRQEVQQAGPLSGLEGDPLRVCQTAPAVPAQPGGLAGRTGTPAAHGRRAPPVARHECVHGGALLAHPTQTPPAGPIHDHSRSPLQIPDPSAHLFPMGAGPPRLCGNGTGALIVVSTSMGGFCTP